MAPPEAAGRWSLVGEAGAEAAAEAGPRAPEAQPAAAPGSGGRAYGATSPTRRLHSLAGVLLDRHGVLTREAVAAEEVDGGFSGVYPILRAMEESGRIRRGYFVEGLGAAQFALPGAVDRLRAMREPPSQPGDRREPAVHLLAAADPANPYGAALPWPRRDETDRRPLQRAAGAYVVLVDGEAVAYLERGGHSLQMLPAAEDATAAAAALAALRTLVDDGRFRELVIARLDGQPVSSSPWRAALEEAGFVPGYRGHALRPSDRRVVAAGRGLPPETAAEQSYWQRGARRR